jgi:hypothetical protein
MEPEGSLPCSQEHATGPCPEAAQQTANNLTIYFFKIRFNIIFHIHLGLLSDLFPSGCASKILYAFITLRTMSRVQEVLLSELITS